MQTAFGKNLKKLRVERGVSLRELASNCDLDDSKISKIENGKFNIQLSTIIELARGLELPARDLFDFEI